MTVNLKTLVCDTSGTAVYAAWKDKYFYPGYLSEALASDNDAQQRWLVVFDDGTNLTVDAGDIIPCELLPVSVTVLALRGDNHKYHESAHVLGHYRTANEIGYVVEFYADKFNCR
jgi:Tumour suppressor p53-binding protein-1 Tudor